jgi:hypothetical protein
MRVKYRAPLCARTGSDNVRLTGYADSVPLAQFGTHLSTLTTPRPTARSDAHWLHDRLLAVAPPLPHRNIMLLGSTRPALAQSSMTETLDCGGTSPCGSVEGGAVLFVCVTANTIEATINASARTAIETRIAVPLSRDRLALASANKILQFVMPYLPSCTLADALRCSPTR